MKSKFILSASLFSILASPLCASDNPDQDVIDEQARLLAQFAIGQDTNIQRELQTSDQANVSSLSYEERERLAIEESLRDAAQNPESMLEDNAAAIMAEQQRQQGYLDEVQRLANAAIGGQEDLAAVQKLPEEYRVQYIQQLSEMQQLFQQEEEMEEVAISNAGPVQEDDAARLVEQQRERQLMDQVHALVSAAAAGHEDLSLVQKLPESYMLKYFELLANAQAESSSNSATPVVEEEEVVEEEDLIQQQRIQESIIDSRVQALLQIENPDLSKESEAVVLAYTIAISSVPQTTVNTNLREAQDEEYEATIQADQQRESLTERFETLQSRITANTQRLDEITQQLSAAQKVVTRRNNILGQLENYPDNPNLQNQLRDITAQLPEGFAELEQEVQELRVSIAQDQGTLNEVSEQLDQLSH